MVKKVVLDTNILVDFLRQPKKVTIFKKTELVLADKNISKRAGTLMRDFPHLYLADALVAATALEKKAFLCTLNKSHFKKIPSLTLY